MTAMIGMQMGAPQAWGKQDLPNGIYIDRFYAICIE
jgi:hypothetical protein